jgi:hypothetical protein
MTSDLITNYITLDEPFGPIDSTEIVEPEVLELLFEQHNRIYEKLNDNPSIIFGRKGSGKTSYLRSVYFNKKFDYYAEIRTSEALNKVISIIQQSSNQPPFPETIENIWDIVLWITIMHTISPYMLNLDDKDYVECYLKKVGIRENDMESVLYVIAETITKRAKDKSLGIISEVLLKIDDFSFHKAREATLNYLSSSNKSFCLLIDSLDDFKLDIKDVEDSLRGLLKWVGDMNKPRDNVSVRFCLPAELQPLFMDISSNPTKDFRRTLPLYWSGKELLILAAQRLLLFLKYYHKSIYANVSNIIPTKDDNARLLLERFLPAEITNRSGVNEKPITYILRHTQLLPRHLILLLNSIFSYKHLNRNGTFQIPEASIINGVRQREELIVEEIFTAYKPIFAFAKQTCEACIPELPRVFTIGEWQKNFNQYGKKTSGTTDFTNFQRMLIQIGAIGKVTKISDMYIRGEYEYTLPRKLTPKSSDQFCVHPLFSGLYGNSVTGSIQDVKLPISPVGAFIEDDYYLEYD